MALTLPEAAKLSTTDLQRGVIETFVQESSILDRLPLLPIEGNAYAYNEEATLPGVQFRAVNEAYAESTGTVNQKSESLVILGGDADVDKFIVKTRGNLNDQRAIQTRMKIKAAAYKFQDAFFNGDVATEPKGFDGLRKRLVGAQVISAGTNGAPIVGADGKDSHAFLDLLDDL
ncbi:major capsid protein, partial [Streptomyces buecherae]|uniref:major capsid protein n=1 Tax=Streptomyces buecherae TaxID=2763006 RepID=UPI003557AFCD